MRAATGFHLLVLVGFLTSCKDHKRDTAFPEFMANLTTAVHAYHSTNIAVAEDGLLAYRGWLLGRIEADKTNSPGYYPSLYRTDARLFQIYEFKGQTNQADSFYREAVDARITILRGKKLTDFVISKQLLREELAREERGEEIGWKTNKQSVKP